MLDRRTFITTAAATPLAGAAVAEPYDPLPGLVTEWKRRKAIANMAADDDDLDRATEYMGEMGPQICSAKPRSAEGLKAQAEYIRYELESMGGLEEQHGPIVANFFDALTEQLTT